jgi:hypothetical protein
MKGSIESKGKRKLIQTERRERSVKLFWSRGFDPSACIASVHWTILSFATTEEFSPEMETDSKDKLSTGETKTRNRQKAAEFVF